MSPSRWSTGQRLLLTDATILVNFCQTAAGEKLIEFLGERLYAVQAVVDELERLAERPENAALRRLMQQKGWPPSDRVLPVDVDIEADVAATIQFELTSELHPDENRGEITTVFYAVAERERGRIFQILTDDQGGKAKADQRGFDWTHSGMLAVEMVGAKLLSYDHGRRVWAASVSAGAAAAYHAKLKEHYPELAAAEEQRREEKRAKGRQKRAEKAGERKSKER